MKKVKRLTVLVALGIMVTSTIATAATIDTNSYTYKFNYSGEVQDFSVRYYRTGVHRATIKMLHSGYTSYASSNWMYGAENPANVSVQDDATKFTGYGEY